MLNSQFSHDSIYILTIDLLSVRCRREENCTTHNCEKEVFHLIQIALIKYNKPPTAIPCQHHVMKQHLPTPITILIPVVWEDLRRWNIIDRRGWEYKRKQRSPIFIIISTRKWTIKKERNASRTENEPALRGGKSRVENEVKIVNNRAGVAECIRFSLR